MRYAQRCSAGAVGAVALAALSACGGGDANWGPTPGSGAGSGANAAIPTSGIYATARTAQGPAAAPTYGLSLIHPAASDAEFVIEPPTAGVTEVSIVASGTLAGTAITNVQPYAAVYIVGGELRRVPLVANGAAPLTRVQRSGAAGACRFVLQANDHVTPEQTRLVVSTAGADGACETTDDGQAEVVFTPSGGISVTPVTGPRRLGVVRNPALAPTGWYTSNSVAFWAAAGTNGNLTTAPVTGLVLHTDRSAVVEMAGSLTVLNIVSTAVVSGFTETRLDRLDPQLTAGIGWQPIGYDATHYYVYRNTGSTAAASNWSVLRIDRQSAAVTQLALGTGRLGSAGMGRTVLYATETGPARDRVLSFSKVTPGVPGVVETPAAGTLVTVATGGDGRHQLWRRPASGTGTLTLRYFDETGTILREEGSGFPLGQAQATTLDFRTSEKPAPFIFATGFGALRLSGAELRSFDPAANVGNVLGTLPGASRFGNDPVEVRVTEAPATLLGGFAASLASGALQGSSLVTFTFDPRTPGSLRLATTRR